MIRGLLALLLLAACTSSGSRTAVPPAVDNSGFGAEKRTQAGRYRVSVDLEPEPPPLGELFSTVATVRLPDGTPLQNAAVTVDARMPQHDHGMETRPRVRPGVCAAADTDATARDTDDTDAPVCRHPDGRYRADGFKFHMSGAWTVLVTVDGPRGPDSTSFVYKMP